VACCQAAPDSLNSELDKNGDYQEENDELTTWTIAGFAHKNSAGISGLDRAYRLSLLFCFGGWLR